MDDKGKMIAERCWHALCSFVLGEYFVCYMAFEVWKKKKKEKKKISFCAEIKEKVGA